MKLGIELSERPAVQGLHLNPTISTHCVILRTPVLWALVTFLEKEGGIKLF